MRTKISIALIVMLMAACNYNSNNPQKNSHTIVVENIMTQCQNFDTTTFTQELPGIWEIDTSVIYDEKWQEIVNWNMILGQYNNEVNGWSSTKYVFTTDGKGLYNISACDPDKSTSSKVFDWYYNAENRILVISGDNFNIQRIVSGFSSEYLVLDHNSTNKYNTREIFKRKTE